MGNGFTILTVCTGNIHRSPLAEVLLHRWVGWYLPAPLTAHVHVESAGLSAPVGMSMDAGVLSIAASLGADGREHRARQLTEGLLAGADLVLTASTRQRDEVLRMNPAGLRKAFTIREAARLAARLDARSRPRVARDLVATVAALADVRTPGSDDDIVDPQGRDTDAYLAMIAQEVPALAELAAVLFGMPMPDVDAYAAAAADRDALTALMAEAAAHR